MQFVGTEFRNVKSCTEMVFIFLQKNYYIVLIERQFSFVKKVKSAFTSIRGSGLHLIIILCDSCQS